MLPQLPNDTRWTSQEACVHSFIKNYYKYIEIVNEESVEKSIASTLNNIGIYKQATELLKQLQIVSSALNKVRKNELANVNLEHCQFVLYFSFYS